MSAVKFNKGSEEWMMFTDFWQLCQKHWEVELTDEYWEKLIDDANTFYEKYKEIPLARRMINAFLNTQEEIYREEIKHDGE
jgi:sulfur relay (sulfurtransferase) DsrC/TusE family protein